jgi:hypothetical protein
MESIFNPLIQVVHGTIKGYGSSDVHTARIIYENLELESLESQDEYDLGIQVAKLLLKWQKQWSLDEFRAAVSSKPLAFPLCSNCGKPCTKGVISCLNKLWCYNCESNLDEAKRQYRKDQEQEAETSKVVTKIIDDLKDKGMVGPFHEKGSLKDSMDIGTLRCKMNINAIKDVGSSVRVEMGAVYSSRPDSENKCFSDSTPSAFFSMDISKTAPASKASWLQPGAQVYVRISLADIPEWNWSSDRYPDEGRKLEVRFDTLEGEQHLGTFIREVDDDFVANIKNDYKYPKLVLEDSSRLNLYTRDRSWLPYYWKYTD